MTDDSKKDIPRHEKDLLEAREDFVQAFKRGAEFTEELLKENERLRFKIADLESRVSASGISGAGGSGSDQALVNELLEKVKRVERERDSQLARFKEVEAENRDFASRYVEVEAENNNLLNIYVASYQLHSTLDFDEVLRIITEIVLNFVGAEIFAITMLQDDKHLHPLMMEGIEAAEVERLGRDDTNVAAVLHSGEPYFALDVAAATAKGEPVACIPLSIKNRHIGVIILFKFLQQKKELAKVDHELFTLLAGHAATAIFSAKLYTDSQRKLNTIQGLIDLVTS